MNVLLCRRMGKIANQRGGGFFEAGLYYEDQLRRLPGVSCTSISLKEPHRARGLSPSLIWIFGDLEEAGELCRIAKAKSIPILLTSTYNSHPSRSRELVQFFTEVSVEHPTGTFLGVFSYGSREDVCFAEFADKLVTIPHPFKVSTQTKSFETRQGICIGDVGKASLSRLVGQADPLAAVREILSRGIPVTGYRQHAPKEALPEGLTVKPFLREGFQETLSEYRLFLNLTRYETFAMVPLEAMSVGTPVVYPYMPQSLTEYIGPAGLCYRNPQELVELVYKVYSDETVWTGLSKGGELVAKAHEFLLGARLLVALQGVLDAFKQRNP